MMTLTRENSLIFEFRSFVERILPFFLGDGLLSRLAILLVFLVTCFSVYSKYHQLNEKAESNNTASNNPFSAHSPEFHTSNISQTSNGSLQNLFGVYNQTLTPVETIPVVPETPLKLRLLAVMSVDKQSEGLAIIAEPQGNQRSFRVGETIPGEAILNQVLTDRVIILRNGRQETLLLPEGRLTHRKNHGEIGFD